MQFGTFVVCEVLFRDLSWDAPVVQEDDFKAAIGNVPGTRNPGAMAIEACCELMEVLGIEVPFAGS